MKNYFNLPDESSVSRPLTLPGLQPLVRSRQAVDACRDKLSQPESWSLHWCTWFDGQREVDQAALEELRRNRWEQARELWKDDHHPISLHNLAVLEHALLLSQPHSEGLWKSAFHVWSTLAAATGEQGYSDVAAQLAQQLIDRGEAAAAEGDAGPIRLSLSILETGWTVERLEEFEKKLLGDDLQRLVQLCAEIRKKILDFDLKDDLVRQALATLEREALPLANFVTGAALPAGAIQYAGQREMAVLYRSIARSWRDLKRREEQAEALDEACRWAPMDLREEIMPELEHVRALLAPVPVEESYPMGMAVRAPRLGRAASLGLLIVAAAGLLYAITPRPASWDLPGLPRQIVAKRIRVILRENADLIQRIRLTQARLDKSSGSEKVNLESDLTYLKKRNETLLEELDHLQKVKSK